MVIYLALLQMLKEGLGTVWDIGTVKSEKMSSWTLGGQWVVVHTTGGSHMRQWGQPVELNQTPSVRQLITGVSCFQNNKNISFLML